MRSCLHIRAFYLLLLCVWGWRAHGADALVLNEFMASNAAGIRDEEGQQSDWIELFNQSDSNLDVGGWSLTTNPRQKKDQRWTLPPTNLPPGGFLVVFASGKNRKNPGAPLHTSFRLNREGEPLLLYAPDGHVADSSWTDPYPPQLSDISYGQGLTSEDQIWVDVGTTRRVVVPTSDQWDATWTQPEFSDEGWVSTFGGVGFDARPDSPGSLTPFIVLDLRTQLFTKSSDVYVRIPFVVTDPTSVDHLTLQTWFPDGFVAFLNGVEVASSNRPGVLSWRSTATTTRDPTTWIQPVLVPLSPDVLLSLHPGTNWLAVQAMGASASNPQFLISPRLIASRFVATTNSPRYFTIPTPGAQNQIGTRELGPTFSKFSQPPLPLEPQDPILLRVQVGPTFEPVERVELRYRVMYGAEVSIPMMDDGHGFDGFAEDGNYFAVIPGNIALPGQMVRWYFLARDTSGHTTRYPPQDDLLNAPAYLGTMVRTNVESTLPIFYWFLEDRDKNAAATRAGARCSVYFDGDFYDNVEVRIRGEHSLDWQKKNFKFDFNPSHPFRWDRNEARVDEINLNSTWSDKAYIRAALSWETFRKGGSEGCRAFPIRIHQNGQFFSVATFVEQPDEVMLKRNGLPAGGMLFKINNALDSAASAEKLLPRDGDFSALADFIAGFSSSTTNRIAYLYDHLDLPQVINYLALTILIHDNDCTAKNFFLYYDRTVSDEWKILPWDKDLTFGLNFHSHSGLTDEIWADYDQTNSIGSDHPLASPSHPLFMDQKHQKENGQWNRLVDVLHDIPPIKAMYLRRLRTLMDEQLQPPETPFSELKFESRIDEWLHQIGDDVALDRARWGNPGYGSPQDMGTAVKRLLTEYLARRRTHLFITHNITNAAKIPNSAQIPARQSSSVIVRIAAVDRSPQSGNLEEQYIEIENVEQQAVDISGWEIRGIVQHRFKPGTVLPGGSSLYLSPNVRAFRNRAVAPTGGNGLMVQGNYQGRLTSELSRLELWNGDQLVHWRDLNDTRSDAASYLRITRIMYHPAELGAGSLRTRPDLEYLELRNVGPVPVNLAGVRFIRGIQYDFTQSAVQILPATLDPLSPDRSLILVRNLAAFIGHYGPDRRIAGEFVGSLDNQGEALRLVDAQGQIIQEFSYRPEWVPVTDGLGFALVHPYSGPTSDWARPETWSAGPWEAIAGSLAPGVSGSKGPAVKVNELLSNTLHHEEDAIELYSDEDADIGGWFLTDHFEQPLKYRIPPGTRISAGGYLVLKGSSFGTPTNSFPGFFLDHTGESVFLFAANKEGLLTGYMHGTRFPATDPDVSYGRHSLPSGNEIWTQLETPTLGATNAMAQAPAIAITEIMYHSPVASEALSGFIELRNLQQQPLLTFDPLQPSSTWHIEGSIFYRFPIQFIFPAFGHVVLLPFDPDEHPEHTRLFVDRYRLSSDVVLLGPYSGTLDPAQGELTLYRPAPDPIAAPEGVPVDHVRFSNHAPWPELADGQGPSLNRVDAAALGEDPANWGLAMPNPGRVYFPTLPPFIVLPPSATTVSAYSSGGLSVLAGPDFLMHYQWRWNGVPIPNATDPILPFALLPPSKSGLYDVIVMSQGGVVVSSPAYLNILQPPVIYQQPAGPAVGIEGSSYQLTVGALGIPPFNYLWRFNGRAIPGATEATLKLNRVTTSDSGTYSVLVSDFQSSVESESVSITVYEPPVFIQHPESAMVNVGERVTLKALAKGSPPIAYFWRKNGNFIKGLNSQVLEFGNATVTNSGDYSVVVSNITTPKLSVLSRTANVQVLEDTDGDGIPDLWEISSDLNPNDPSDALLDADGDHVSNWAEFQAGTDPKDPNDYLKLSFSSIDPLSKTQVFLSFVTISNRSYTLQVSDRLGSQWNSWMDFEALRTNTPVFLPIGLDGLTGQRQFRLITPRAPKVP